MNLFKAGWFRSPGIRGWVLEYYRELRSAWHHGRSGAVIAWCRDCGIAFLTPAANYGRTDLRCPLGCRKRHTDRQSSERSKRYYQSPSGRDKKWAINRKRSLISPPMLQPDRRADGDASRLSIPHLSSLLRYYHWLLLVLDGIDMGEAELKALYQRICTNLRQQGPVNRAPPCHIRSCSEAASGKPGLN